MSNSWLVAFQTALTQTSTEVIAYVPRFVGFLLVLLLGLWFAKLVRKLVVSLFGALKLEKITKDTPLEYFMENAELGRKVEDTLGMIAYWLIMLVVLQTAVSILGLTSLLGLIEKLVNYLPQVISAVLVLFLGVILAGLVERLIKGSLKSAGTSSAIMVAKVGSYMVMALSVLMAISELGIAREFILILFVGLVIAISLGSALAFGLGGQDLVRKLLDKWYKNNS